MTISGPLRIGKIRYLNCLPFFFGLEELLLEKGLEASFFESHPAAINQAMRDGTIDAAPVSSLEYLQRQDGYVLLAGLGIGTKNFVRSVIMVSRKKIEQLDGEVIALSEESLSSAGLLRILLKQKFGLSNSYEVTPQDPEAMLRKYPAALLIGDEALFCQPKDMIYKYDLGAVWQEWTGKPFVFSLWVVRREFAEQKPASIRAFGEAMQERLSRNLSDPELFLKEALEIMPEDKRFCQLLGYFMNMQYTLDAAMEEGLMHYFDLAHREGLAPAPQPLKILV